MRRRRVECFGDLQAGSLLAAAVHVHPTLRRDRTTWVGATVLAGASNFEANWCIDASDVELDATAQTWMDLPFELPFPLGTVVQSLQGASSWLSRLLYGLLTLCSLASDCLRRLFAR